MSEQTPSRRERYREQTREEIMAIGLGQIAAGGVAALSMNAIAKQMAVSGAALYRYFAGRDDLLTALVVQAYEDLAQTMETAAAGRHRSAGARVQAVADAYRNWALAKPHCYRLVFSTWLGADHLSSKEVVSASARSMNVFLSALGQLPESGESSGRTVNPALAAELTAWHSRSAEPALPASTLRLGIASWTRLHGLVSLELDGHLRATTIDPALLYSAEVADLIGADAA
ncbi:WHG domain-containing protein [Nakamurella panacisegetis]|uniref:WHG domain-containing protein n=2 Tax=Nakamurella panacisegetis TaxID=1090615 RepID=A0A1H0JX96_9ACTN|nr:WHG domain-containing protein [Nakamurella panacisegetis]